MKLTLSVFTALPLILPVAGLLYIAAPITPIAQHHSPFNPAHNQQSAVSRGQDSAATTLYLPDDLEATLWAESPMLRNPTSMDVDAKGRIWVTEAVHYRSFQSKSDAPSDGERIVILEDTNGDGKADNSKVFVTDPDLVSPLGIAVIGTKVIVSCSPNLIVYTDENGDDKPDRKDVLLTGFGGLDHDHGLHAVVAGPDGKYYFNVGNAGPHIVSDKNGWTLRAGSLFVGGSPYNKINHGNQVSDDGRVWTGGLTLRINPDGSGLKVMGHNSRNSYETALDSYGNLWQNDNDDEVTACRVGWLMEGGNAGYSSNDGTRTWQADQRPGQLIPTAHWHQEDPNILPVGDITGAGSPTGMVICEGDELGTKYRGMLLSADAGRNVIFSYKPQVWGAGYQFSGTTFLSTLPNTNDDYKWNETPSDTRKWFRPSDVTIGPDGAIYVADWYDPVVGGNQTKDRAGYGRIYRIAPKGKSLKTPKIDLRTIPGQIAALLNPAVHVRMLGFDALKAQGEKAVEPVMALLSSANPYYRARAIYLLAHLGGEGQFEVERLLKASDAQMRITALRALRSITPENSKAMPTLTASQQALMPLLGNLSADQSMAVRREVAVALRDVPYADCRLMLLNLVKEYDGRDGYYLNALGQAADGKADALYADLLPSWPTNPIEWTPAMANVIWELHPAAAVALLVQRAEASGLSAEARHQAVVTLGFINSPEAAKAMIGLTKSTDQAIAAQATYWTGFRRDNSWATLLDWNQLMPMPANKALSDQRPVMTRMLAKRQVLLDEAIADSEKRRVALEMARDAEGGKLLVGLAADAKLSAALVNAIAPVILKNPDQTVRTMAKEYFSVNREDKPAVVEDAPVTPVVATAPVLTVAPTPVTNNVDKAVAELSARSGNAQNGLTVFKAKCASCHRYGQQGNEVGPQLTNIHQKLDKNGLLEAIMYPSAGIASGYEAWLITTKAGQTYYGFLTTDNEQSVVIKSATGQKHTIPADNVFARRQYKTSLMPDASTMGMTPQQLADVTAFMLKQ